jgi:hypothetical protein
VFARFTRAFSFPGAFFVTSWFFRAFFVTPRFPCAFVARPRRLLLSSSALLGRDFRLFGRFLLCRRFFGSGRFLLICFASSSPCGAFCLASLWARCCALHSLP